MRTRNDQVFQLSLTEIAFTLVFILLVLFGYLIYLEQARRETAEIALAKTRGAEASAAAIQAATNDLKQALASAGTTPESLDAIILKILVVQNVRDERDRLKKKIEDLDAQLSAMTELQKLVEVSASKKDIALDEVMSALNFKNEVKKEFEKNLLYLNFTDEGNNTADFPDKLPLQWLEDNSVKNDKMIKQVMEAITTANFLKSSLKKQLDLTLNPSQEAKIIEDIVAAARNQLEFAKVSGNMEAAKKENADLRGQVAFFKRRLESRGGRDFPPCWATVTGSPEYLFSVELTPIGVKVQPRWPSNREADAKTLSGIDTALQTPVSLDTFVYNIQGIFNQSRNAAPECRHYVLLKSNITDAVTSDRARLTVEKYFYKNEVRR